MKVIKKVIDILIVITSIILLFVLYGFIEKYVFKKDYINYFGYTVFEVVSGSMAPSINVGDLVVVSINSDINTNDIITYKENDYFVTHRVIRINEDTIIAKGDYNDSTDKEIQKHDVLGKVIKIIPNVGIWKKVFSNIKVIISVMVTFIFFGIYFSLLERREKHEKI